jgi:peptidoglycan-N-acetylglucosamine deacetylase
MKYSDHRGVARNITITFSILLISILHVCMTQKAYGGGPSRIATIDRTFWPYDLTTRTNFDLASRLTILLFIQSLQTLDTVDISIIKKNLNIKSLDTISLKKWKVGMYQKMVKNFNAASMHTGNGFGYIGPNVTLEQLKQASKTIGTSLPVELSKWYVASQQFCTIYLLEQARLAALFGRVSSEILTYSPAEVQGYDFPDMNFLLTFDDGPTLQGGSTDKLIALLRKKNLTGTFFVLGENFRKRVKATSAQSISELYVGMSVQTHGMVHNSVAKSADGLASVESSISLIDSVLPEYAGKPCQFRPPYGQRLPDAASQLARRNCTIFLWNIDTQDWNSQISDEEVASRTLMLMFLWRSGIILFHDIHEKATHAIPEIVHATMGSGVVWMDSK